MAKSVVMDLFPFKISFNIVYETEMALAKSFWDIPLDSNSSFNISPGWMAVYENPMLLIITFLIYNDS
jgi:hypothetical protein